MRCFLHEYTMRNNVVKKIRNLQSAPHQMGNFPLHIRDVFSVTDVTWSEAEKIMKKTLEVLIENNDKVSVDDLEKKFEKSENELIKNEKVSVQSGESQEVRLELAQNMFISLLQDHREYIEEALANAEIQLDVTGKNDEVVICDLFEGVDAETVRRISKTSDGKITKYRLGEALYTLTSNKNFVGSELPYVRHLKEEDKMKFTQYITKLKNDNDKLIDGILQTYNVKIPKINTSKTEISAKVSLMISKLNDINIDEVTLVSGDVERVVLEALELNCELGVFIKFSAAITSLIEALGNLNKTLFNVYQDSSLNDVISELKEAQADLNLTILQIEFLGCLDDLDNKCKEIKQSVLSNRQIKSRNRFFVESNDKSVQDAAAGEPETPINHEEGPVSSNEEYNKGVLSLMRCPF